MFKRETPNCVQRVELSDSWFSHLGMLNFSPPRPQGLLCLLERDCLGAGAGRNKQQPKREQVGQVSGECPQGINKILERKGCGQGGGVGPQRTAKAPMTRRTTIVMKQ